MKKIYSSPKMEIQVFNCEDILTASGISLTKKALNDKGITRVEESNLGEWIRYVIGAE